MSKARVFWRTRQSRIFAMIYSLLSSHLFESKNFSFYQYENHATIFLSMLVASQDRKMWRLLGLKTTKGCNYVTLMLIAIFLIMAVTFNRDLKHRFNEKMLELKVRMYEAERLDKNQGVNSMTVLRNTTPSELRALVSKEIETQTSKKSIKTTLKLENCSHGKDLGWYTWDNSNIILHTETTCFDRRSFEYKTSGDHRKFLHSFFIKRIDFIRIMRLKIGEI